MSDQYQNGEPFKVRVVNKRVVEQGAETPPDAAEASAAAAEVEAYAADVESAQGSPGAAPDEAPPQPDDAVPDAAVSDAAAQYLDDLRRLKAEFENFRKRTVREQSQLFERASASIIDRLLPVLDNFELALLAADRTKDFEAMVRGVQLVYAELLGVLEKEGLQRIEAEGKPFDPEQHEAVMQEDGEGDHVVVADVVRKGYTFGGRVLRPAMVKVKKQ